MGSGPGQGLLGLWATWRQPQGLHGGPQPWDSVLSPGKGPQRSLIGVTEPGAGSRREAGKATRPWPQD